MVKRTLKAEKTMYSKYYKRIFDFILSLIMLIFLSPFLIIVAILIKVESNGSIFFRQDRPGKDKKIIRIYKFRTMVIGAEKQQKVGVEVIGSDNRITPFGKILRRFKIDELAQLINILQGDMSIVGPRPTLPEYIEQYEEWELKRFDVRPGLTGLAQINGNIYLDRQEKSSYDVMYVNNISFVNDLRIMLKTVLIVFLGEERFINKKDSKMRERNSGK